jgi:hypothetical protein
VLSIHHAKALQGKIELPPSPDLFCVAAFASLASGRRVRIHPVRDCPSFKQWKTLFDGHAAVTVEGDACIVDPRSGNSAADIVFVNDQIPYRDLVVFLALGTRKRVMFRTVPEKRLALWRDQSQRIGFSADIVQEGETRGLALTRESPPPAPPSVISEQDIHPALGLFFGLRVKRSFQIDFTLSTPFRLLSKTFGYDIAVKRDIGLAEKDPIVRRMRLQTHQRLSSQDQLFTIAVDFPTAPAAGEETIDLLLPGDEVLLALFLAAKSLIHKGSFVIGNAPLEPWAMPIMTLMRKMGSKLSQQETHQTAFGSAGIITLAKFDLTGQKTDFVPHFHYASQLPSMAVLAAFAEGQSLFRNFGDLRLNDPDGIRLLETCLRTMNVKFGDIPDGFVIKGNHEHDGFDLIEPLPAYCAGAFAIAGLHCVGSTTVNDELLLERWPDFHELIEKLFEFRTS